VNVPLLIRRLKAAYPDARCALTHENPLELLVSTILSAQCTDARVNLVTPALFRRYPSAAALRDAEPAELESIIRSTGFYRNKAKSIRGAAREITERFGGEVPRTMGELLTLPGVARKTANVVLGTAFGIGEGVVVDTHVHRLTHRLGIADGKNPVEVERQLMERVPREEWIDFPHLLIHHGRAICTARAPRCGECPVQDLCPSAAHFLAGGTPVPKRAKSRPASRARPSAPVRRGKKASAASRKSKGRPARRGARAKGLGRGRPR
jgi:endonuclease III